MICRHKNFQQIDLNFEGLCHFPNWEEKFKNYRECVDCGVWKGRREDSHCYDGRYYQGCNIIVNGIPKRAWYWGKHKVVWDEMKIPIDKFGSVLELGCGIGRLLWTFYRESDADCVGVEGSKWACEWQKETYGLSEDYKIVNENCDTVDYSKLGKFDFVYGCHILEHLLNPMEVIEKCFEVLKPGGYMYFVVPDKVHQMVLHVHDWAYDERVFDVWFKQVGLKDFKYLRTKPHNPPPPPEMEWRGHYLHVSGRKT